MPDLTLEEQVKIIRDDFDRRASLLQAGIEDLIQKNGALAAQYDELAARCQTALDELAKASAARANGRALVAELQKAISK
jgi:hypothetical protein